MQANHAATPNFIRIGHPAYTGANRAQWTNSKSKAIEILRTRGVKRDDARRAINRLFKIKTGACGAILDGGDYGFDAVELAVFDLGYMAEVGMLSAEEARAAHAKVGA